MKSVTCWYDFHYTTWNGSQEEVLNTVKAKLEGSSRFDHAGGEPKDFDNVLELDDPQLPILGARVVRGPNWKWENQDTDGAGTVINHVDDNIGKYTTYTEL